MEENKITEFLENKNEEEKLTKQEKKLKDLILNVEKMNKRIHNIEKVPVGKNFHCACGCGKMSVKNNMTDKFKRISGQKNCKDKYHGRKREVIKIISELSKEEITEMKNKSLMKEIIERTEETYKKEINRSKNEKRRKIKYR